MAKKEENKTTNKSQKKTTTTDTKGKGKSKTLKKSGEVKGPMKTGEEKKTKTRAKAKEPSKINQPTEKSSSTKEGKTGRPKKTTARKKTGDQSVSSPSKEEKKLPGPKKSMPKKTTVSKAKKEAKPKKETDLTSKSATAKKTGKTTKASKKTAASSAGAKKKTTTKKDKKSDSSTDLKETAKATAKKMVEKVLPDEETQQELTKTARELLPDKEEVKKTAQNVTKKFTPDPETLNKVVDKIIPEEKDETETPKTAAAAKFTLISDYDVHLFKEGKHFHLYKKFGSHLVKHKNTKGVYFSLWAPNAEKVTVMGDFNSWDRELNPMKPRADESGIWEAFIPEAGKGNLYKYFIRSQNGYEVEKGDPFAFSWETPPHTASMIWDLENTWTDSAWMEERKETAGKPKPVSVYELHIGSWRRKVEEESRSLTYLELAQELPSYLFEMGFTHVEFMPVMEHPFYGSWGYQITGYFAPSSRFGSPQDFMKLIESLHEVGIGVILDWVPSHFPSDVHGLHYFDGTFLYEHADPKKGFHPDWKSYIFNYGRNEVRSFLISNALFWLDKFHVDGLRVDAVASMLYLDYSRKEGEWEPNEYGGRENLEAISFLKEFNETVYREFPDAVTIAEESTAWPMVSKPTYVGGLGFGMKWMMGWMHDTLEYFQKDPVHRKHHQNTITFSTTYAFSENFMLPLSHDEVVYGKQSIFNKMPGDQWNKFANLRSLYSYMFAHPGAKLLFMGAEFAQTSEWDHDSSLDWHLTQEGPHQQVQETFKALNKLYKTEPALYEISFEPEGFEWINILDSENSVISFLRKSHRQEDSIMIICNLTPVPRENYRTGVPDNGKWKEIFNSDDARFGGSNVKNVNPVEAEEIALHNKEHSIALTLPPMGVLYLKKED